MNISTDSTASASPAGFHSGAPVDPTITTATPAIATATHATSRRDTVSPNQRPATSSTIAGCSAPISVAFATVVILIASTNNRRFAPKTTPAGMAQRSDSRQIRNAPHPHHHDQHASAPIHSR